MGRFGFCVSMSFVYADESKEIFMGSSQNGIELQSAEDWELCRRTEIQTYRG